MALQCLQLQSHLMRMALRCITSQLSLSQLDQLSEQFERYDSAGDGKLSDTDVRQLLEDVGVIDSDNMELIIASLDSDRSGFITYSEFIASCISLAGNNVRRQIRTAFNILIWTAQDASRLRSFARSSQQALIPGRQSGRPRLHSGHVALQRYCLTAKPLKLLCTTLTQMALVKLSMQSLKSTSSRSMKGPTSCFAPIVASVSLVF